MVLAKKSDGDSRGIRNQDQLHNEHLLQDKLNDLEIKTNIHNNGTFAGKIRASNKSDLPDIKDETIKKELLDNKSKELKIEYITQFKNSLLDDVEKPNVSLIPKYSAENLQWENNDTEFR